MEGLNNKKLIIIWIDKNIYNKENKNYLKQLGYDIDKSVKNSNNFFYQESYANFPNNIQDSQDKNFPYITKPFQDVKTAINFLSVNIY